MKWRRLVTVTLVGVLSVSCIALTLQLPQSAQAIRRVRDYLEKVAQDIWYPFTPDVIYGDNVKLDVEQSERIRQDHLDKDGS